MKEIYQYIDKEIKKALPENWRLIPKDKLLGKDDYKICLALKNKTEVEVKKISIAEIYSAIL